MIDFVEYSIGRLYCGQVRDFLNECIFKGLDITFFESKGWLDRSFVIKGKPTDIKTIRNSMNNWITDLDEGE